MNVYLKNRSIFEICGQDRFTFLQGLITNDIFRLSTNKILYAALLTPQGRYLYDFFLIDRGDYIWIDCEQTQLVDLKRRLSLYKLRTDVQILDVGESVAVICTDQPRGDLCFADPRLPELGFRCYQKVVLAPLFHLQDNQEESTSDNTLASSMHLNELETIFSSDDSIYRQRCLRLGVPSSADLIEGKGIPLECGLDELNAIAWDKGCYMGQELTARTRYRGLVRKRLFPVTFQGDTLPFGAEVHIDGQKVGRLHTSQDGMGLAMIRLEAAQAALEGRQELSCEGKTLTLHKPHWMGDLL